ncbi:MAG TPA: peptide-methionine (S)-S-oxide reductase MsrA [Bacteroidota bacterium]|nr:peptide-methionine (S)-S-oxide reductase MsrA [Bacteroidota bacterium]
MEKIFIAACVAIIAVLLLTKALPGAGGKRASTLGAKAQTAKTSTAEFAAGCFWHVEDTFRTIEGVVSTEVGYEGGSLSHPSYADVCTDRTGHAETVRITYDSTKVSYDKLLETFFALHDPTTVNRQGLDVGTQYRSVIFVSSPLQREKAEALKAALEKSGRFSRPIATEIIPSSTFWRAEEYHQQYYEKERGER